MKTKNLVLLLFVFFNFNCNAAFCLKDRLNYPSPSEVVLPKKRDVRKVEISEVFESPFEFTFEPIDAVIPCHKKDLETINMVINGIRKNVKNIRRIIVVSESKLTDKAEWFDERKFPFTQYDIAFEIFQNEQKARDFMNHPKTRIGWIFQQFLKNL